MTPTELIPDLMKVGLGVGLGVLGEQWLQARNRRGRRREELRTLVACVERIASSVLMLVRQIDKIGPSTKGMVGFFGLESSVAAPGDLTELSRKVRVEMALEQPTLRVWRNLDERLAKSQSLFDSLRKQQVFPGEKDKVLAQIPNLRVLIMEAVDAIAGALATIRAHASKDTKKAIDKLLLEIK